MTLTQISVLLAVVDAGGFTQAGKRRFMSQSAVSQAIATLEAELGVPLLQRERRKEACLTPAGERIAARMRAILHEVNAVKELAEQEKRQPVRQLRVGSFPSVCASILPYVVRYFETHHPQVKIIPHEANSAEIIEDLRSQQLDAGFVHFPVPEMYSFPVYKDKFTVVVPEEHPFSQRASVQLEDLFDEALIISKGRYELSIMSLFEEQNITPIIKYEFNHPATAMSFIHQGLGIALLPELTLKTLAQPLHSVALEPAFYRHISLIASEPPVEGSPLALLEECLRQLTQTVLR
ncbi:LysR family transcriptional regulator [Pluralibacter sp.]|uniref:LysR family transcriptional regulator n=1 Tax=Pluralibacter sp. TaxID=1920032 RepID=UPI0025FE32DE|nr:LysR family transcriptional regulator [Pluralibacter sp.]MBV8042964.1 LysR family transcriptional regulator [Pluralibacter sp.]